MTDLIAPPGLFSAHALAAFHPGDFGFDGEPDGMLAKGTHLRIFAGSGQSFPITPFAVYRTMSSALELFALSAPEAGVEGSRLRLEGREARAALVFPRLDTGAVVRVDLLPEGRIRRAALYDPYDRLLQARNTGGWQFAAPVMQRFRVEGDGPVVFQPRVVDLKNLLELQPEDAPDDVMGLPARAANGEALHRWYLALGDESSAFDRVSRGSPTQLTPMDRPVGPFDLPPGAELERVMTLLASDGEFNIRLWKMLDADGPPWAQQRDMITAAAAGVTSQTVHLPASEMLQVASLDPGIARYFGYCGHYELSPDLTQAGRGRGWDTFAVLGLFALDPRLVERLGLEIDRPDAAWPRRLIMLMMNAFQRRARDRNVAGDLARLIRQVQSEGLVVAPFVTFAAPVLPPLAPQLSSVEVVSHLWQTAADQSLPSDLYRASFAFPKPPMAALAAMRRDGAGGPLPRHRLFDTNTVPARAVPRLLGHEREANSRHRMLGRSTRDQRPAARIADENIPADDGIAQYRFSAADIFGRFGPWTDPTPLGPPPRPLPPAPTLSGHVERRTAGLNVSGPLSMGVLQIAVAVPAGAGTAFSDDERMQHGRMIVVPRLDELPAGALPLSLLRLRFSGESRDIRLDQPGVQEFSLPLPDLVPPALRDSATLSASYIDSDGVEGPIASRAFAYVELRPPPVHETGVGLYWTSAPGPSLEVELDLVWSGQAGASYRVYLTDAIGLGLPIAAARMSRGDVAIAGCRHVLDGAVVPRDRFRLLTPQPIATGADLQVHFSHRLPRTMAIVQFLRIVPVGPDGGEPSFDHCPVVPLAVPEGRRPPAPRLDGNINPDTGMPTLTIVADGFNLDSLRREEPGLFEPGKPGTEAPQFRLRQAVAAVADPVFARAVANGGLPFLKDDGNFQFEWTGGALEPFVQYFYWAEVRLPPERRGTAGVDLIAPANGIVPPDERRRAAFARPYSPLSAVRMLVHMPPDPPAALDTAKVAVQRAAPAAGKLALTITIAEPPKAHAAATDRYRLAIWSQWPDSAIEPADPSAPWPVIGDGVVTAEVAVPPGIEATAPLTLRLAVVDPAGRPGAILNFDVPGAQPPGGAAARRPTNAKRKAKP